MKKLVQLVLLVAVVLGLACGAGAEYYDEGHSGTEADPYVIDTNADLVALRDRVNAGTEEAGKYYKLTQNLNIAQYTDWEPIGTEKNPFTGHFDGNNLSIHVNITQRAGHISGVFGVIETLEGYAVRNLTADGNFTGRWIGGIAQKLDSGTIENCTVTGTMTCYDDHSWLSWETRTGGIVDLMTNGSIKNCTFRGTINTTSGAFGSVGGIVAKVSGGSIENCIVGGADILGADTNSSYAGGIVGYANIANFDAIKDCTFSGTVVVEQYAGGIAGYVSGGNIQNNRITGNANGQAIIASNYASGGIAGRIGDSTILESCDVSSIVTVAGGNKAEAIGGIVGIMNASTLRNNQSYASIEGDIVNMGGVVGKLDAASYTISNNRYSSAEHGIGNNAQGVPSEEGCIMVGASISITTSSLPDATAESAYSVTLTTDASSSVVWSLTNSTTLPRGLTLDRTTGTISGTPENAGDYTFTVKASPASGAPATKEFTLKVQDKDTPQETLTITTTILPSGTVNTSYSATLAGSVNATRQFSITISDSPTPTNPTTPTGKEDDPGKSSGGGGCDSGFAGLGLALLASIFRKSRR